MSPSDTSFKNFLQALKERVPIEQVVAEYVPTLTGRGSRFKGLCPFHKEKTASFHVAPEHQFYHCFGCGAHGDVIKFVQEIEKVEFMVAVETLARRAGLEVPKGGRGRGRSEEEERRLALLREICTWAEAFFIQQLKSHPRAERARAYLHERGLTDDDLATYRIGYAPDSFDALLGAAQKNGWTPDLLAEAGLASRRDRGGFLDRFRDRIMFPIGDRDGQTVAFAGRWIEEQPKTGKYINSAETPIFKKSRLLYGWAAARKAIRDAESVVILEGYMDWIAMHRQGLRHVLAGMGTALTEEHTRLIKGVTRQAVLLYDGDAAGRKAMFRATELLLRRGLDVRAAALPEEHDPDTFLQAEGTAAMRDLLDAAPHAVDYFMDQIAREADLARPEGQAEAVGQLAPLLMAIEDPALREGYMERAAGRFHLRLATLEAALRRRQPRRHDTAHLPEPLRPAEAPAEEPSKTEQTLLYLLTRLREKWDRLQTVDPTWFSHDTIRGLFERLLACQRDVREGADPPDDLIETLCDGDAQRDWFSRILLMPTQRFGGELGNLDEHLDEAFEFQLLKLRRQATQRRRRELTFDLQAVMGENPVGNGQLAEIDGLARETVRDRSAFLDGVGPRKDAP